MTQMESIIEENFFHQFQKFCIDELHLKAQLKIETRVGQLRPDFVLSMDESLITFECDGDEFHERSRDDVRDAILLGDGHIHTIYHLGGPLLTFAPVLAIKYISKWEPELFSIRSKQILDQAASLADYRGIPDLECRRYSSIRDHNKRQHW